MLAVLLATMALVFLESGSPATLSWTFFTTSSLNFTTSFALSSRPRRYPIVRIP